MLINTSTPSSPPYSLCCLLVNMPQIEALYVYPIKSCRGIKLQAAVMEESGEAVCV